MQATFIQACVQKDPATLPQMLPNLPTQVVMNLCQICVDLLALHQHALDQDVTPATADPPTFTGLLANFREELGYIAQFAWRIAGLSAPALVVDPPPPRVGDAEEDTLMSELRDGSISPTSDNKSQAASS